MRELYELKEKLCDELKEYGGKEMSAGSLDVIDKLSHSIKNIDKIIENYEGGYSGRYDMYDGRSYARKRDSMGRYSSRGFSHGSDMISELRGLMADAPDDRTRQEFQRFIHKIEEMN